MTIFTRDSDPSHGFSRVLLMGVEEKFTNDEQAANWKE